MKPHGKGKISSGQSIHIYLRISRNLEDEIFPKGVGVVTPKFLFGFFKRLLFDLRGVIKKISSRELSLSNIFFMAKVLFGFNQDLSLVLEVLAFHLDSRQNVFHLGKITFENLFGNALWLLENSFATFNNSFLPWP